MIHQIRTIAGLLGTMLALGAGAAPLAYVPNEGSASISVQLR